ncbi:MAG: phage holin family protein [Oscillospiraceae bacterium]|jgi:hypothetical protein|nr:phage holin family protein [Oscillospiraceae bacterium]
MEILDYIMDNCFILIPALNIIGKIVKETKKIPNEWIPFILLAFGVAGCLFINGLHVQSVVQGVFVTGAAVYGNQVLKQATNLLQQKDDDEKQEDGNNK